MATPRTAQHMSEYAKFMKANGIRRTTGRCCVCYKTISIPTDNHFKYYCK